MKAKCLVIVAAACALCGCGLAAKDQARNDMMQAKTDYTQCLHVNSADPQKCAGLKEAYEADLQAYRATAAGTREGYAISVDQSSN